jgi:hypothetical protein
MSMRRFIVILCCFVSTVAATLLAQSDMKPFREGRSICVPYVPATLKLVERPNGDWLLERVDGAIFRGFANREDADAGLAVARQHTQLCYIGKDNTRPNRVAYIMEYWR